MQHHDGLLLGRFHRHEPHRRPGDRLTDRLSVCHVILLALHVGLHMAWRDQSHLVNEPGELASPVVRRTASLDPDQAGTPLCGERQHPAALQSLSYHDSALSIDTVYLEDRRRNVQSDRNNLFHGFTPSWAGSRSCRRDGEPSTTSKDDIAYVIPDASGGRSAQRPSYVMFGPNVRNRRVFQPFIMLPGQCAARLIPERWTSCAGMYGQPPPASPVQEPRAAGSRRRGLTTKLVVLETGPKSTSVLIMS
jgi:hypothetical protein